MSKGTGRCASCDSRLKLKRTTRHPENGTIRRVYLCVACGWRCSVVSKDRVTQSAGKVLSARQASKIDRRSERIKAAHAKARPAASHVSFRSNPVEDEGLIRRVTGRPPLR